ncbi:MAG: type II toxin-antitoxin system YafQ family toxin [Muribaculaceae bacterium]|nr:type II toxin-antitoxin system YafQ family toxin [Muribaculaceae bacterium]
MKYIIDRTNKFKKSVKKCQKRGLNTDLLKKILLELENTGMVSEKHRPHKLVGKYAGKWECHIEPDWLLIWEQNDLELILLLIDTGSHADIFG